MVKKQSSLGPIPGWDLDLALVVDTTGSMGTHLAEIRRNLLEVVTEIKRHTGSVRCGVVAFKDHGEGERYLTRTLPLTSDMERLVEFLFSPALAAGLGGGGAEAVECALHEANDLTWRPYARKALVLIGDKPPHGAGLDGFDGCPHHIDYRDEIERLAEAGISVYSVRVGDHLETQRVFEYFSARTGGTYLDLLHVRDLPSSIVSVCHKETGDLPDYCRRLERAGRMTDTRRILMHALAS